MISINQPYFFPNIGFFSLIQQSSVHVYLDCVKMRKKSWITRNKFDDENYYSLKVHKLSQNRDINEHFVIDAVAQKIAFRDYVSNIYRKYKYTNQVLDIIDRANEKILADCSISEFNFNATKATCEALCLNCQHIFASDLSIDQSLIGHNQLIALVKKLNEVTYLNLEDGRDLYSETDFLNEGIKLRFNRTGKLRQYYGDDYFRSILRVIAKFGISATQDALLRFSENER